MAPPGQSRSNNANTVTLNTIRLQQGPLRECRHSQDATEMSIEDAELGKLTRDHLYAHEQVARQKAELEQIGESLILLGSNLRKHPQDIRIGKPRSR